MKPSNTVRNQVSHDHRSFKRNLGNCEQKPEITKFSDFCTVGVVYECNICPPERLCNFFQVQNGIKTLKIFLPVHSLLTSSKMPRRNRIPLEHRERIVRAFDDEEEDYLLVADTLGVNRSTARGIVALYIREGRIRERPRGGRNNVRVDDEMRDCLEEIINENCLLTLTQINHELRRRLPVKPEIHDRTVSRTLDGNGMLFRVKLARPLLADRNRPDVLNKRVDYTTWFMNYAVVRHCVCRRMRLQHLDGQKSR